MYFVVIVLFVYNDYCFSFVSLCDHCVVFLSLWRMFFCDV